MQKQEEAMYLPPPYSDEQDRTMDQDVERGSSSGWCNSGTRQSVHTHLLPKKF